MNKGLPNNIEAEKSLIGSLFGPTLLFKKDVKKYPKKPFT